MDALSFPNVRAEGIIHESLEVRLLLAADVIPPKVLDVLPLPAEGGSITEVIERLTVQVNEDLQPAGVNASASWSPAKRTVRKRSASARPRCIRPMRTFPPTCRSP